MSSTNDLVRVVERAYSLEGDSDAWLLGILEAARPALDRGMGVLAYGFDAADPTRPARMVQFVGLGVSSEFRMLGQRLVASAPAPMIGRTYRSSRVCATASESTGLGAGLLEDPVWKRYAHPTGMIDNVGIKVFAPKPHRGFMIHAPMAAIGTTTPRFRRTWEQIAVHIAAGARLREALRSNGAARTETLEGAEAILDSAGRVAHAEGVAGSSGARESLRRAVLDLGQARGPLRRFDPGAALELWKGLVRGRWSLVDHFEASGRRYLVARRNDPQVADPRSLTLRERQVLSSVGHGHSNKLIAYELGIGLSTVATHIGRIKAKLGVTTRTALIAMVRSLPTEDD